MAATNKKKKKEASGTKAGELSHKPDTDVVQEAYSDDLKKRLTILFDGYDKDPQGSEHRFVNGLAVLRKARDRALQLVQPIE